LLFSHCSCAQSNCTCPASREFWLDADISSLLEMLGAIGDPRRARGKQYPLAFVLAVCVVATLAGAKGYSEIARKARDMTQPLLEKLGAEWDWFRSRYKWPSKWTIRLVLSGIDGDHMDRVTGSWLAAQSAASAEGQWDISVDGKVMRGAWTAENEQVTLFSAMIREEGITVAQVRVPDGTNETTQASALLDSLPVPESDQAVFTLDAAHTQKETAEAIRKRPGWHYVMTVKGNQPTLQRAAFDAVLPFLREKAHDFMEDRSRGQRKTWSCWAAGADGIDFPGAAQAAIIIREVFEVTGDRIGKEMVLLLTSADANRMSAATLNRHKRSHWGVENMSHYPRDTVYREDHNQTWTGDGPQVLASIHSLAMGLIRLKGINKIKESTEWVAGDRTRALQFMAT
jgi:predicted transposase YbfD/YdcC